MFISVCLETDGPVERGCSQEVVKINDRSQADQGRRRIRKCYPMSWENSMTVDWSEMTGVEQCRA